MLEVNEYPKGTLPPPDKLGRFRVPLGFVAQLDLADLASYDDDGLLPKTGMLWLFARQEVVVGEQRDLRQIASHVLYAKIKGPVARTPPPSSLPDREHYAAAAVTISHEQPLPPSHVEPITRLGMIASEVTTYDAAPADHGDSGGVHACLGWANATYFLGIPTATDQLLLHVGSDSASRFQWGDAASIFFCIPSVALAKQDFAKTHCLMDE